MLVYIQRRILLMVPILIGVTLAVFLMLHALPGDPVLMMLTEHSGGAAPTVTGTITDEMYENMRRELGLDKPLHEQYIKFLFDVISGDWGNSFRTQLPVSEMLLKNLPYSIDLALASLGVSLIVGLILGIIAAIKRGTWIDNLTMTLAVTGVSMPNFWLGIMLLLIFSLNLRWIPAVAPADSWQSLILPSLALGFSAAAIIARLVRSNLIDIFNQDYIRTARAKGLMEYVVVARHALKNAMIPVITVAGLQFGNLLGGTVIIETVFARPGLGMIMIEGIMEKDFPVVQGAVLFAAIAYVVANFVVDITYAYLDPRITYDTE